MEVAELRVSPGRLTMHFEVELGFEVRSGRWRPRALAQQQCGGFLGQAAPARILHHPAFYHPGSRRDGGHQGWGRGARVRGRPAPQHPARNGLTSLRLPLVLGQRVSGFAHPKPPRGAERGAPWCSYLLSPEASTSPFHFHFPSKAGRRGGGSPLCDWVAARGRQVLSALARQGSRNSMSSSGPGTWAPPRPLGPHSSAQSRGPPQP